VDSVCCESTCTGKCMACAKARTGATDGYCRAATAGTNPHNDCAADATACGHDGTCDGAGACRYQGVSVSCGAVSCAGQGTYMPLGTYTPLGHCNGGGTCLGGTAGPCPGNMPCASSTTCATTCTPFSTTGCPAGYKCAATGQTCVLATVPCGGGGLSCPVANGGGDCCIYNPSSTGTSYAYLCLSPGGVTCAQTTSQTGQYIDLPCHSKSDCPAGQVCCARSTSSVFGWTAKCVAPYPADPFCHQGSYNGTFQLCDPTISPSECMGTTADDNFGTSCTGTGLINDGGAGIATCQ
jgi:hypothetical protein